MKKMGMVLLVLVLMMQVCLAEGVDVYVSITNSAGEIVLAHEKIAVSDSDGDGVISIHDALACAHAEKYEGSEGYLAEQTEYGMSLVRLWGEENNGSLGYYLNHASAWSLMDAVQEGDHVKAYAYTDLDTWSDTYCYFDADEMMIAAGEETTLKLNAAAFDAAWNPVVVPVAGACLVVDGVESEFVTDENGCVTLKLEQPGVYVISAKSSEQVLVPPVCIVTVK